MKAQPRTRRTMLRLISPTFIAQCIRHKQAFIYHKGSIRARHTDTSASTIYEVNIHNFWPILLAEQHRDDPTVQWYILDEVLMYQTNHLDVQGMLEEVCNDTPMLTMDVKAMLRMSRSGLMGFMRDGPLTVHQALFIDGPNSVRAARETGVDRELVEAIHTNDSTLVKYLTSEEQT